MSSSVFDKVWKLLWQQQKKKWMTTQYIADIWECRAEISQLQALSTKDKNKVRKNDTSSNVNVKRSSDRRRNGFGEHTSCKISEL